MAEILLEDVNPNGNIQAIVEAENDACYFYLCGASEIEFDVKSVWVCNLVKAPVALDAAAMKEGSPPLNPRKHCRHPGGRPAPAADDLSVVWLPEGNGAGLYEGAELLAVIPPWSGCEGFHGFARECIGEGPVAWELQPDNAMIERLDAAARFWSLWEEGDPWRDISKRLTSRIERSLGKHSNYYAIDGGEWPPKAMLRIPRSDGTILMTAGVSIRPQPDVEMAVEDPGPLRRIELGALLPQRWSDKSIKRFGGYLSGQSSLPWSQYTWLGPGHTIPCDAWQNRAYRCAALVPRHPAVPEFDLGEQFGDPVTVLWLIPLTEAERDKAISDGSGKVLASLPADRWESC
jgi:hypothetical protein